MVSNEDFHDEMKRLVNAFGHRLNGDMIAEYYTSSLKYLSAQQLRQLVDRAKEEFDKFPTLKQMKILAGELGYYSDARRVTPYVVVQCVCGASICVERAKINERKGKVLCVNNFYDHPLKRNQKLCDRDYSCEMLARCKEVNGVIYMNMNENLGLLRAYEQEMLVLFPEGGVGK